MDYVSHIIQDDICYIAVSSNRKEVKCPYCGQNSTKVHSTYDRTFQDLPIFGKKAIIKICNKKFFCSNPNCSKKTFAEHFEFLTNKCKKTRRLENEIVRVSLNCSSVAASEILKKNVVDVGKSTICSLLKKRRNFS